MQFVGGYPQSIRQHRKIALRVSAEPLFPGCPSLILGSDLPLLPLVKLCGAAGTIQNGGT